MVECTYVVVNVMLSLMIVMSPTSCLVQPIGTHRGEVMYFGCVCFRVSVCVANKQFELLEIVFNSVYVGLQYDKISTTFTAGFVSLCCVCSHVVVFASL